VILLRAAIRVDPAGFRVEIDDDDGGCNIYMDSAFGVLEIGYSNSYLLENITMKVRCLGQLPPSESMTSTQADTGH
jgi:hypothetical protein